jgi:hypothetical protein
MPGYEDAGAAPAAEDDKPWTRNSKAMMDTALREVARIRPLDIDVAARTQLTYGALEKLGGLMSETPGRKNIVWITDGVPITLGPIRSDTGNVVDFTPLLKRLSLSLERSQIAIYPVPQIMLGSTDGPPDVPGVPQTSQSSGVLSADTLNEFAGLTGGRADTGGDIAATVSQAQRDARTSYELGYYAPDESQDGRFHKLRVTCTRKGVRIQAKTGYYAWAEEPGAYALQTIRDALERRADAAEVGIRATLVKTGDGAAKLKVVIEAKDIALLREADRYKGQLSFLLSASDASGAAHPSPVRSVALSYSVQERDRAVAEGIDYTVELPAGDGWSSFRFVAFDDISRAIGSITIPGAK